MLTDCNRLWVGDSLGGVIAELDIVYLCLNLQSCVTVKGVTYGAPRVGILVWANWFDSKESIESIVFARFLETLSG